MVFLVLLFAGVEALMIDAGSDERGSTPPAQLGQPVLFRASAMLLLTFTDCSFCILHDVQ